MLDTLIKVLQRCIRIETRLTRLCVALGVDATAGDHTRLTVVSTGPPIIELVGLDTTFAEVLAFCRKECIVTHIVTLMHKGQVVGSVALKPSTEEVA